MIPIIWRTRATCQAYPGIRLAGVGWGKHMLCRYTDPKSIVWTKLQILNYVRFSFQTIRNRRIFKVKKSQAKITLEKIGEITSQNASKFPVKLRRQPTAFQFLPYQSNMQKSSCKLPRNNYIHRQNAQDVLEAKSKLVFIRWIIE